MMGKLTEGFDQEISKIAEIDVSYSQLEPFGHSHQEANFTDALLY